MTTNKIDLVAVGCARIAAQALLAGPATPRRLAAVREVLESPDDAIYRRVCDEFEADPLETDHKKVP